MFIDPSANTETNSSVIANATGSGIVYQTQLGDLSTLGTGDGSFDGIDSVDVEVADGNADVTFAAINLEKMRPWVFGEQKVDTDSDGDLETETIEEPSGYYPVTGLETLGDDFSGAQAHDIRFPVGYSASDLSDSDDAEINITETPEGKYPDYQFQVDAYYRLSLPQQYDLSHSGVSLTDTQSMPSSRYVTVEYAEGVSDTDWSDISSWTDVTGSYAAEGSNITLDSTVQPGSEYAVHYQYVVTDSNKKTMKASGLGGLGGGGKEDSGGIFGSILAVVASILSVLGLSKAANKVRG